MTPRKIDSMSKGTTRRTIRVDEELWTDAQRVTAERGESVSEIVRVALTRYVAAEYLDKRDTRTIILETINELREDLTALRAGKSEDDFETTHMALDHFLWNVPDGILEIFEEWLRSEIRTRQGEWGLPINDEDVN